jgi:hypothetical protein
MNSLTTDDNKRVWFEGFIYIFNMHWDKVDNFRIDKYLMFLRFQFNELMKFLKQNQYLKNENLMKWYQNLLTDLVAPALAASDITCQGIPL